MDQKKKILVVEDDKALRTVLVDRLAIDGFEVSEASDGEEGLAKALSEHPDLIMLDIVMPKMDGIEVLEKLRADEWGKEASVMMLTNLSDNTQIKKAASRGVEDYLVKAEWDIEGIVSHVKAKLSLL